MTVSTTSNRVSYAGNGTTTVFSFPNKFLLDADLVVLEVNDTTGVSITKTLTTHYTVSGAGAAAGGSVTMLVAPATGVTLVIYRDPALTQPIDLVNGDDLDVDTGIERGLDRNTLQIQRLRDLVDRAMRLADGDTSGASVQLPIPVANTLLGWNSTVTAIENKVPANLSLSTVTAFVSTLLDDSTAAAFVKTLRDALTDEPVVAVGDDLIVYDASAAAGRRMTVANFLKAITILTAETAPDVADELAIYDASAATVDKITLANLFKVINGLTEDTSPDGSADFIPSYDTSATSAKKIKLNTLTRYEDRRQSVIAGSVDANGQANFLVAGSSADVTLNATTTPVVATFAAGEDATGPINYRTRFAANQTDYWASIPVSNLSFLFLDRDTTTGTITAYKTLVPPQYRRAFDTTKQALLHFEAADATTVMTDDYGSAWTVGGNAQIDTAQFKFGTSSLLLDGTGDFIKSTAFSSMGDGGWTVDLWIKYVALPASTAYAQLLAFGNAGNFGANLLLYNNAGTYEFRLALSSDGATDNIANLAVATVTPVIGTWHHVVLTFDSVAGVYRTYFDGVAKHAVASALKICSVTKFIIGINGNESTSPTSAHIDEVRISPCCRYPAGTTFTPAVAAYTADAEWFDLSEFKWKFGSPTAWTDKHRVCVGEVVVNTAGAGLVSLTTYALRGGYTSALTTIPASGTAQSFSHNLGTYQAGVQLSAACITANKSYVVGDRLRLTNNVDTDAGNIGGISIGETGRNTAAVTFSTAIQAVDKGAAGLTGLTNTSWKYELTADRGW